MTPVDAGPPDTGVLPDAGPPDTGPPPPSTLFGPCVMDSQCPGDGAFCRMPENGWPEGYCTVPCVDRTPCDFLGVYHHCLEQADGSGSFCERRCGNGYACERPGYTCIGSFDSTGNGMCIGLCGTDLPMCGPGAECNAEAAECVAPGTPVGPALQGQACEMNEDCASERCQPAFNGATPTGFNGGYCFGPCIIPAGWNTNTLYATPDCDEAGEPDCTLPSASCPGDSICFPDFGYARGDLGVCLDGCVDDSDCREAEGYHCVRSFTLAGGTRTFVNGICQPINCMATPCPAGYTCNTVTAGGRRSYVCAPG